MRPEQAPRLLLVDDDPTFCRVLAGALGKRRFAVRIAHNVEQALVYAAEEPPGYAVVDLRLGGASGLSLLPRLKGLVHDIRIVVLTGYASITTAVEAIKLGATYYLAKPADADEIVAAFGRKAGETEISLSSQPLSVARLEWEHIQKVLAENDGNISATARALGMHRRTLQRKLGKRPSKL
jgi:two-component system, response regulator RegA